MKFAVVDCETTGLEQEDEPVSIGVLLCNADAMGVGAIVDSWYGEQSPSALMSAPAGMIHGIAPCQLTGKYFNTEELRSFLDRAELIFSHNARFDARMIGKVLPDIVSRNWRCSLKQTRCAEFDDKSLDSICAHFSINRPNPHNALLDCEALLEALVQRTGKTARSKTYLQRLLEAPRWPVFLRKDPFLTLNSTNDIIFSYINEPVLMECSIGTQVRLWTSPNIDFVVGYARINGYCGSQGECFRFKKVDNPAVAKGISNQTEYVVSAYEGSSILVSPSRL
jgi:DNA polymerase III subunit epsilon